MNKLSVGLLLAAGLFFIDVSPAAAHQNGHDRDRYESDRGHYVQDRGHYRQFVRSQQMPRWLRRNANFRHWYRNSPLRHYRQIGWQELLQIYRAERRYFRTWFGFVDGPPGRGRDGDRRRNRH